MPQEPRINLSPFCRILWGFGGAGLLFGHLALFSQWEPFYSAIYTFLWWPAIFCLDYLAFRLRGWSLLSRRPWEFLILALWSTPVWLIFEIFNFRVQNWYYIQVPADPSLNVLLLVLSFGTVLPGVFTASLVAQGLLERFLPAGRVAGPVLRWTPRREKAYYLTGLIMAVTPLLWPRYAFPLLWGFAFFLLDPLCRRIQAPSLLARAEKGDYTRALSLALGGLLCGGLWEFWNLFARTKWIYTVPFFDTLKIGEMPLAGFLGYPPFALECFALSAALSWLRRGRHWTRDWSAGRPGMCKWRAGLCFLALAALIPLCTALLLHFRVFSFSEALDLRYAHRLSQREKAFLIQEKGRYGHQFLKKKRPETFRPELWQDLRRLCRLSEIKGMGLVYAEALTALGVKTPEDLTHADFPRLSKRLREEIAWPQPAFQNPWQLGALHFAPPLLPAPSLAQVKLWQRAAP